MRPTIVAIVGVSGSGKTYLTKFLHRELNIPCIVSHTTRKPRFGEIDGEDYIFIDDTSAFTQEEMLTYTRFGEYEYFALRSQIPDDGLSTYVVDENGAQALKAMEGEDLRVMVLIVKARRKTLLHRGIGPGRLNRDKSRKSLKTMPFDLMIENDGPIEEFQKKILLTFATLRSCLYPK